MLISDIPQDTLARLRRGGAIPAHPLALTPDRKLDEHRQRVLSRYYLDAGSIGLAVGVHTTQFEIREAGLYDRVLELAAEEAEAHGSQPFLVGGVAGATAQATSEAKVARALGYHAVLLSLAGLDGLDEDALVAHCAAVAEIMPVFGFYLQPAVGGRHLSRAFWERFAGIENVVAIKAAPFNRYFTLDVVHAVVAARAEDRISLYTGNDDHIVADLLTEFRVARDGEIVSVRFRGGLLGHWAVWTRRAVELMEEIRDRPDSRSLTDWLAMDALTTYANSVLFDVDNNFAGCIAALHEVLRRQGLLEGTWCLNPEETMGPGQEARLGRLLSQHPELTDDQFVKDNIERWLR
ncbi:dihydrodipicolinate synthase family protein [Tropicimonas sp. IMCC6043]|uniref:dihydrodipicolinate synthase family protein n=1 Tax=Tropicimonas sp. IMCC6043 TaxID=2510645 RepID=UPI00101D084E|nr:dihydrodipicolinate synthase family protein [Tropicimonas sp. IMCC6043]RYH08287.1 dihydrodipicolinate synthase family protein [Tropicimonas sp. IMCC6043]